MHQFMNEAHPKSSVSVSVNKHDLGELEAMLDNLMQADAEQKRQESEEIQGNVHLQRKLDYRHVPSRYLEANNYIPTGSKVDAALESLSPRR